jgi:membrane protease YdiL (CAAX protease family)
MNVEDQQVLPTPEVPGYSGPWKFMDNWIGIGLMELIDIAIFAFVWWSPETNLAQSAAFVLLEAAYILPVVLILAWRRVHWKQLGFGKFEWKDAGIGCGLLVASYSIIIVYGLLLLTFGIETQGQQIAEIFAKLDSPIWFFIGGTVAAPFVEEVFFRGFLFQGLRENMAGSTPC